MQLQPFGLCANLTFCDESTDSQAVLPIDLCPRVNQLRNIALETPRRCRNLSTGWSVTPDSETYPSHPQTFPQGGGVSGSGSTTADRHHGWEQALTTAVADFSREAFPIHSVRCCPRAYSRNASNYAGRRD